MTKSTKGGLQGQTQLEIRGESLLYERRGRVSIVFLHENRYLLRPIKGWRSLHKIIGKGDRARRPQYDQVQMESEGKPVVKKRQNKGSVSFFTQT
jgi:hypothetical protein